MTPEEILQIHKNYADQFASLAQSGLAGAFSALSGSGIFDYHPAGVSIQFPDFGQPNPVGALPKFPKDPTLPKDITTKDYKDVPNDSLGSAPNPGYGSIPAYSDPPTPQDVRNFTDKPPADPGTPTMPALPPYLPLPDQTLPYPTVDIPNAPLLSTPTFEGQRPTAISMPDPGAIVSQYAAEQNARRNMLPGFLQANADALIAKYAPEYATLRARINNAIIAYTDPVTGGGTGIPTGIEGAILARASDRNNQEFQRAIDTSADTLAKKGYQLPPGALLAVLRNARTAMGDAQVKASTDIATKNFELEQQNFQLMFKMGEQLEEKMIDMLQGFMKLALEIDAQSISSAKEIVSAYIGAYNVQALIYRAMWDGYSADAAVYNARINAMEALVREYEAEIKAEMAKTEVNTAHVNILRAVADVNQALANTYKAQVDAAMAPLEAARISTAIFEAKARGYGAEVGAYESRWRGYAAQVEGRLAPFKAYEASVQGYTAQVAGYKGQVDAYSARVSAVSEQNRAIASINDAKIKTYATQAEVAIKTFEGLVAAYSAESNVVIKQAEIEVERWRTQANLIFQEFNVAVQQMFEFAREEMNLFRGQMEAAINAANGLAHASQVAGNLAGQAMGGLTSFAGTLTSKEG
jgi:hypothetical protein